ncbi:MAG: hypothetical protein ACYC2O_08515, partial [Microthrixaceae bacterium]
MNDLPVAASSTSPAPLPAADLIQVSDLVGRTTEPDLLPVPVLGALASAAETSPSAIRAIREAASTSRSIRVTFSPEVMKGLRDGSLGLMRTTSGDQKATAVNALGQFVEHGRVVSGAGRSSSSTAAGVAGKVGTGAAITSGAAVMLPLAIASIATYQQQKQLEQALHGIQVTLDRIEERLQDSDHGVCDAADAFVELASRAIVQGPLPDYLRMELAAHRARVEALYGSRRRYIARFKAKLEQQQIAFEQKKGERQPWVDEVEDMAKNGKLEEEIVLFVRSLIAQSRLDAFAALCIAEDGNPQLAARMLEDSAVELRREFFDLHNRLAPLA